MRPRSSSLLAAAAVGGLIALAGCGGGGSNGSLPNDPKAALSASVGNLSNSDVLTTTFKLDISPTDLQALARADGDKLTTADAEAIASAQLVFQAKTSDGSNLSENNGHKTDASIRVLSGGSTYLEMRVLSGDLFLNADVKGFLGLIHKDKTWAEVQARAGSLPPFVQAIVNGKWVTLSGAAAQGLASNFGITTPPSNGARSQRMVNELKRILTGDVSVTRAGSDDRGDHLVITGNTRKLATDLYSAVAGSVPGAGAALSQAKPQDVPSRSITVDAWVKDGVLSEISLDVAQFAKPGEAAGKHLPVALTFEQSGDDIEKPANATPVDLSQLGGLLGALSG